MTSYISCNFIVNNAISESNRCIWYRRKLKATNIYDYVATAESQTSSNNWFYLLKTVYVFDTFFGIS